MKVGLVYINVILGDEFSNYSAYAYFCYFAFSPEGEAGSPTSGLRPVFTIKPEIKITGGTGNENDPYILGT